MREPAAPDLVGRDRLLAALDTLVDRVIGGERVSALIAGEAGIGKTSLLRAATARMSARGGRTAWGTCLAIDGSPGFWPWTQAIGGLLREAGDSPIPADFADDAELVATIVPSVGTTSRREASERNRLLAMDATRRLLETLAADCPVLVVLDDLQWADPSSLELIDLITRSPIRVGLGVIGAYRSDELSLSTRRQLSSLVSSTEHFHVEGLDVDAVRSLAERATGVPISYEVAAAAHDRTGGHPFFVRELALMGSLDAAGDERVPSAVRDAIERRVELLPQATIAVLEISALVGLTVLLDVVASALSFPTIDVDAAVKSALDAGVLTSIDGEVRFAHDLLRETLHDRVGGTRRVELHTAIGSALEGRVQRGVVVPPSELARHFLAAVPLDGPDRAVRWTLAAAAADRASLAFVEAAAHPHRLRSALAAAGVAVSDGVMVELLVVEADALARSGMTVDARELLRHAAEVAERAGPEPVANVALATARLGARFATRRDEIVRQLDHAREVVAGVDDALEACVTATLARELQHSVAADRPRAAALSERALDLGRRAGEPTTMLDCLIARHDVLWQPGNGAARADLGREIVEVAIASGDVDRQAEGLLLVANALLEQGSPAFEGPLESCLAILDARGQPRHRYTALTRRACVALLRNHLDRAEELMDEARALGDRILEPDAGNVYMSQHLELVRARAEPDELSAFAAAAVAHWTGAPIHAHAVAAGFLARAGDLVAAEHHVDIVVDLGTWRADRSYLWSVFTRELACAAIALDNRDLCLELLNDLRPLDTSCGVNGAVVAFAGCHAHTAGLLAAAVGQREAGKLLLERAAATYRRLGAVGWTTLTRGLTREPGPPGQSSATMRRLGPVWQFTFAGKEAAVAPSKGLADIARMLAAPGREIHVLDLYDAPVRAAAAGELADHRAIATYRRRLADLDAEIDDADRDNDPERVAQSTLERDALIDEIRRVTGVGGRQRQFANHPAERARKAVTGRVRDAIRKLEPVLPDLAAHLQRTIVTGMYCRYRPDTVDWKVDTAEHSPA
jgi:hypothetical protein